MKTNKKMNVLIRNRILLFLIFIPLLVPGCSSSQSQSYMEGTAQDAYNLADLNGYGEWVSINNYGNVWHPYAVNDWMPFDNGHWVYANANWTWISYEPFGWIVYHYGYWYDDPFYGWVWMPSDGIWSPANVMWTNYGDYIGWAPLAPRGVVYGHPWGTNQNLYWHVVRTTDFTRDNIRDYRVMNPIRNENDGREVINKAPDRQFVERSIGRPVPEVTMNRQTIKLPERQIQKMNLPQQENKRVEQNSPRVRKEVIVSREEFHKREGERNQERNNRKK